MLRSSFFSTCALIGSLAIAGAALAADELGRVSAVGGDATAQQPGAEPRALACGDPVFAGDTLHTGSNSSVSVQLDDVATHLDANTQVVIGRTPANTPSARLVSGKVRMVDPRDEGAPAQLAALDTDAQLRGNDAEAYIFAEKVGPYAMMCEWDAPLPVSRGTESKTADPGECVIAKPKEPLYTANAHDQRIPALAQECGPGPGLAYLDHLSPTDIAAMGPGPDTFQPAQFEPGPGYVCDQAGVCSPVVPVVIAEPPPVIDPCPPGFCNEPDAVEPQSGTNTPPAPPTQDGPPPFSNTPPAPPVTDVPVFTDTPPAPPVTDAPPYEPPPSFPPNAGPPAQQPPVQGPPPVIDAPPPFANTPPAPPVTDVPVFTDTPPAPPVGNAPPYIPPPSFPPNGNGPNA